MVISLQRKEDRCHYGNGGVLDSPENYSVSHDKENETPDCYGIIAKKLEGKGQWHQESSKWDRSMQKVSFAMYLSSGLQQQQKIHCLSQCVALNLEQMVLFDCVSTSYQWATVIRQCPLTTFQTDLVPVCWHPLASLAQFHWKENQLVLSKASPRYALQQSKRGQPGDCFRSAGSSNTSPDSGARHSPFVSLTATLSSCFP